MEKIEDGIYKFDEDGNIVTEEEKEEEKNQRKRITHGLLLLSLL